MAYLIFSTDGQEWDRRELTAPLVLGRSADCEISVHDILLSRRHCRFSPVKGNWLLVDLGSSNGTAVGDHQIEERILKTGDIIRVGKTRITFRAEAFAPARTRPVRPALPPPTGRADETMAGSVFDLDFEPQPAPIRPPNKLNRPTPKPRPKDPVSFETDDLYSMLEQIASSSWDSIYAMNAQPLRRTRLIPQPMIAGQPRPRPTRPPVSIALQASIVSESRIEGRGSKFAQSNSPFLNLKALSAPPALRRRFAKIGRWITRVGTLRLF